MAKEIERQWLITEPVKLEDCTHAFISQAYILAEPDKEIRIREREDEDGTLSYKLTMKTSGDLTREEIEVDLTQRQYSDILISMIGNCHSITKDYYKMILPDGHVFEQSIVDEGAFCYAEVEFKSELEAANFEFPFPEILIKEVTYDDSWKMKNYWNRTRNIRRY